MADKIFKCGTHDFSTDNIAEWDKHCAEIEHDYDLHIPCANLCGNKIHIKPNQKLAAEAGRIPRGHLCKECQSKVQTVPEIKEAGEK